jgi:hypothetical protein
VIAATIILFAVVALSLLSLLFSSSLICFVLTEVRAAADSSET